MCPSVTCRAATVHDSLAAALVNVRSWKASFPQRATETDLSVQRRAALFRQRFEGPGFYRMVVAEAANRGVVGFADVGAPRDAQWGRDVELYALYVLHPWQRRGVGGMLFACACEAVHAQGLASMVLIALEDSPYRVFYERHGGRVLARRGAGAVPGQDAHVVYVWDDVSAVLRC